MLHISQLSHAFGAHTILRDVSFSLESSEVVGLIGPSGGGKSVLLKVLGQVLPPLQGSIKWDQHDPSIGLMFQEGALFDSISVFDNVAFPLVGGRVPICSLDPDIREDVYRRVSAILARVGLSKAALKMPCQLSGGMRRRVSLARALVAKPAVLLLDDPTAGLDPVASSVIMGLITELCLEYKPTTMIVSHDLRRLFPAVERLLALFDGTVCFDGTLGELEAFRHPLLQKFVRCRYDFS